MINYKQSKDGQAYQALKGYLEKAKKKDKMINIKTLNTLADSNGAS